MKNLIFSSCVLKILNQCQLLFAIINLLLSFTDDFFKVILVIKIICTV